MFGKRDRLLDPDQIPATVWDKSAKALRLPAILARSFVAVIESYGLSRLGADEANSGEGPTGGMSQEETNKHFAQRFDGAAARVQLALLDPSSNLGPLPDRLLLSVSANDLCMTDAPCGAGAATLGLLSNLAELRRKQVLPRLPLDVHLIGAELSDWARAYAGELFSNVRNDLEEQEIFVNPEWLSWDVTNSVSTSDLIRRMTQISDSHPNHLVLVANFSGFLSTSRKLKQAQGPVEELFRHPGCVGGLC